MKCPICKSNSQFIKSYDIDYIGSSLTAHFGTEKDIESVKLIDYKLHECSKCTLQFFDPMTPGDETFYDWVCSKPNYYPKMRWEFKEFDSYIAECIESKGKCRVLDVGCGSGIFLKRIKSKFGDKVDCVGVDITPSVISEEDGVEFVVGDHRELTFENDDLFDLVTSFHCLEHIDDPVSFTEGMSKLANEDGFFATSTPLSPMSFEFEWDAIMNSPPHHLTRWNEHAYNALAATVGMKARFVSDTPSNPLGRALGSLTKAKKVYTLGQTRNERVKLFMKHPLSGMKHLIYQLNRPKLNGKARGEDILVFFEKK